MDRALPEISGKTGWPWTKTSQPLHDTMQNGHPWPKISIVTPSYNQGQFLEETIRSVLLQGYPNLEYIIIDGGSTDNSIEIIKKYASWLTYWVSEKDRGQSHAINKGWSRAKGQLIAYLNSDDIYLPNALQKIAEAWDENRASAAIVGAVVRTDELSKTTGTPSLPFLPSPAPIDLTVIDHDKWFLPQQPGFFNSAVLDTAGRFVREDLQYAMDRELYYRICSRGSITLIPDPIATYRLHKNSKTISTKIDFYREGPKALLMNVSCDDGFNRQRRKVGRWRLAQGHYALAKSTSHNITKVWHLVRAIGYRPGYFFRLGFWIVLSDAFKLRKPLRWLWHRMVS